jgi:hypothetical protein
MHGWMDERMDERMDGVVLTPPALIHMKYNEIRF